MSERVDSFEIDEHVATIEMERPDGTVRRQHVDEDVTRMRLVYGYTHEELRQAKNRVLRMFDNPQFIEIFKEVSVRRNRDVLYFSQQPQNGKTAVMISQAWMSKYVMKGQVVVILDNSREDVKQFLSRVAKFNQDHHHPNFRLDFLEIKGTGQPTTLELVEAIRHNRPILMTTKVERYDRIKEVFKAIDHVQKDDNRLVNIIYDEADMSVGSVKADPTQIKEQIYRSLPHSRCRFVYVTATPLAVWNSPERSENLDVIALPNNLYPGLEYRDFFHRKNEIKTLEGLEYLSCTDKYTTPEWIQAWNKFIACVRWIVDNQVSTRQPNITLINVSFKNEPKDYIARKCTELYRDRAVFATYTEEGLVVYREHGHRDRWDVHVGAFLQAFKEHGVTLPIFILATSKADRSQTFKSDDHEWRLTHFFLDLSDGASLESAIQSWRCNGQYRPDDVGVKIFCSARARRKCEESAAIAKALGDWMVEMVNRGMTTREALLEIPLLKVGYDLTRSDCQDFNWKKWLKGTDFRSESLETVRVMAHHAQAETRRLHGIETTIEEVTTYHEIPILEDFIVDRAADQPFKGMESTKKTQLKNYIRGQLQRRGLFNRGSKYRLQVCYGDRRYTDLNMYHWDKEDKYKTDVIALDPKRTDCIPVVIYRSRPPTIGSNKIVIWHTTDGAYCYRNLAPIPEDPEDENPKLGMLER